MNRIKKYKDFTNESIFGGIRRLIDSDRKSNDSKAKTILDDIKKDFNECNKNLFKVKMALDNKYSILWYRFKYHDTTIDINNYANEESGDIRVKVQLNSNSSYITIEEVNENPKYVAGFSRQLNNHPTDEEREKLRRHNKTEQEFEISKDIANLFIDFFKKEYERQYPNIKGCRYYNGSQIKDIKRGLEPVKKYIEHPNKDGDMITRKVRKDHDERVVKNMISKSSKKIDNNQLSESSDIINRVKLRGEQAKNSAENYVKVMSSLIDSNYTIELNDNNIILIIKNQLMSSDIDYITEFNYSENNTQKLLSYLLNIGYSIGLAYSDPMNSSKLNIDFEDLMGSIFDSIDAKRIANNKLVYNGPDILSPSITASSFNIKQNFERMRDNIKRHHNNDMVLGELKVMLGTAYQYGYGIGNDTGYVKNMERLTNLTDLLGKFDKDNLNESNKEQAKFKPGQRLVCMDEDPEFTHPMDDNMVVDSEPHWQSNENHPKGGYWSYPIKGKANPCPEDFLTPYIKGQEEYTEELPCHVYYKDRQSKKSKKK